MTTAMIYLYTWASPDSSGIAEFHSAEERDTAAINRMLTVVDDEDRRTKMMAASLSDAYEMSYDDRYAAGLDMQWKDIAWEMPKPTEPTEPTLFRVPVTIAATAYVKAHTEDEAVSKALDVLGEADLTVSGDNLISGKSFDSPDLPEVSLSPAMTVYEIQGYADQVK